MRKLTTRKYDIAERLKRPRKWRSTWTHASPKAMRR